MCTDVLEERITSIFRLENQPSGHLMHDPEEGGTMFLQNVSSNTDYTALYSRKYHS
jgi:hypothetical protein